MRKLRAESRADRAGKALPEAAGGHIYAGSEVHIAVAGQMCAAAIEGQQLLFVKVAAVRQRRIDRGARVSLRAYEPVAPGHFRVLRVYVHLLKIQNGQKLDYRKAAAYMADAEIADARHDIAADILAYFFKITVQDNAPPDLIKRFKQLNLTPALSVCQHGKAPIFLYSLLFFIDIFQPPLYDC